MREPSYLALFEKKLLSRRRQEVKGLLAKCSLCPRECGINRLQGEKGFCRAAQLPVVSSSGPHFGEEPVLVGRFGSGAIFFTHCNLCCVFCQNYDISQLGRGQEVSFEELASIMLSLQKRGCHNINFVSPTHMVYPILQALLLAIPRGFRLPLVYNSGGYDSVSTLRLLEGIFDIYLPDFKYSVAETALKLSGVENYPETAKSAIAEMFRQVGDLKIDPDGVARRGLIVRHLVLPDNLSGTEEVIEFLARLSPDTYLNLMDQYRPEYRAGDDPRLGRRITREEFSRAVSMAREKLRRVGT